MRLFLAICLCKLLRLGLRLFGRGGTAMPGRAALRLCPDLISRLSGSVHTIMITGTNGKTTTARMVETMLTEAGCVCFANRSGSNLRQGVAADFASNAGLFGSPRRRWAVIECDEAAFRTVCGEVRPLAVVVTNLFRDQLDRFGELTHTLESIRAGLEKAPEAVCCYNADCPLCASLGDLPNPRRPFGMDAALGCDASVSDAPRCVKCGGAYEYEYRTFAHLGGFYCPRCGYRRPCPAVSVRGITALGENESRALLVSDGREYPVTVALPGAYNLYNAAAAVAAVTAVGLPASGACASLSRAERGFGRQEVFELDGVRVTVILIKNPAGCDRAVDYVASLPGDKLLILCLSDNDADGADVSWIWDACFERLLSDGAPRLAVSGTRKEDMRLRLKYAGAEESAVAVAGSDAEILELIKRTGLPAYILPTYTAMLPIRQALATRTGKGEFWK